MDVKQPSAMEHDGADAGSRLPWKQALRSSNPFFFLTYIKCVSERGSHVFLRLWGLHVTDRCSEDVCFTGTRLHCEDV